MSIFIIDTPPYGFVKNDKLSLGGIYYEIFKDFSKKNPNIKVNIQIMPFARVVKSFETENNLTTFLFENNEILKNAHKNESYFSVASVIIPRIDFQPNQKSDFYQKAIGRLKFGCRDLENNNDYLVSLKDVANFESGLKIVLSKRLDGICTTEDTFLFALKNINLTPDVFGPRFVIKTQPVYLFTSKKMNATIKKALIDYLNEQFKIHNYDHFRKLI